VRDTSLLSKRDDGGVDERLTSLYALRAAVLFLALTASGTPLFAQRTLLASALPTEPADVSVSGVVAFGFAPYREAPSPPPLELADMLPPHSDIPAICRPLLDDMWRGSATFRRQWIRLAAARVQIAITFDTAPNDQTRAQSKISRRAGLRVRISLRLVGLDAIALLAHELEHVLEQLDGVDLAHAVASHVHGAKANGTPPVFETRRAIVVGRLVAAEVQAYRDRRE
jgi:hypothetical protein